MLLLIIYLQYFIGLGFAVSVKDASFKTCQNRQLDSDPLMKKKVKSDIECGSLCLGEKLCNSANYLKDDGECELYSDVLSQMQCDYFVFNSRATLLFVVHPCKNNQLFNGTVCVCKPPLTGQHCETGGPKDCSDGAGGGWVDVYPDDGNGKIRIFCWFFSMLVFAAPENGFPSEYLNKTWDEYKNGFGEFFETNITAAGAYWLGNENIHRITNGSFSYELGYSFTASFLFAHCKYEYFKIDSEAENYRCHYNNYNTLYDVELSLANSQPFRTSDRNDDGCAAINGIGFWFDQTCSVTPPLFGTFKMGDNITSYKQLYVYLKRIT